MRRQRLNGLSRPAGTALALIIALLPALASSAGAPKVSYQKQVRPILEQTCVACHGCYDAPCQLKLETPQGLDRGASKLPVYGVRKEAQAPSRLFIDAQTTHDWRQQGFFSVLAGNPQQPAERSLLLKMLELGRQHRYGDNQKLPDDIELGLSRQHSCPKPDQFDDYASAHPHGGMPFAVTGLSDEDYATLSNWLKQGGELEQETPRISAAEQQQVEQWETFLNQSGKREQLVARWLYEHLFLAHIYVDDGSGQRPDNFFQLQRSLTPPGQPLQPVTSTRPNDPVDGKFWYRLTPITGTIIHKRHITYPINASKLARTRQQFFAEDWTLDSLPGYDYDDRANPFVTFAAIPARARYQFMLDEAEYFTRTFIRGPVCRGQIATDVIRDQFWAVFQDPDEDLFVTDRHYHDQVKGLLGLPGQKDDLLALGGQWRAYSKKRNAYQDARQQAYAKAKPQGPGWSSLWDGDGHNSNALLTIFRHHDNSSVRRGLLGDLPLTTWVMDYPLFERSYYNLVVNFNVFGSISHQTQTRLYFDLIRNGAEQNTLRYLPAEQRKTVLEHWYQGTGKLRLWLSYNEVDTQTPSAMGLTTNAPVEEFNSGLLNRFAAVNARPDPINRCGQEQCRRADVANWQAQADQALSRLASRQASNLKVIDYLPEVSFLQVEHSDNALEVYTLTRNRAHSNVAFMLGESLRYQPQLDTLTIYPGILASYPNFIFRVSSEQLDNFVKAMDTVSSEEEFTALTGRYGVRRSHPHFWRYFQDLGDYLHQHEPIEAGILDINRYQNL